MPRDPRAARFVPLRGEPLDEGGAGVEMGPLAAREQPPVPGHEVEERHAREQQRGGAAASEPRAERDAGPAGEDRAGRAGEEARGSGAAEPGGAPQTAGTAPERRQAERRGDRERQRSHRHEAGVLDQPQHRQRPRGARHRREVGERQQRVEADGEERPAAPRRRRDEEEREAGEAHEADVGAHLVAPERP
ncbi:MAG: hypothetical protein M5U13_02270 [Thermoanaerobaculia bacterium]|nr:hypothetical protein [Thermoanaerobaculia bacterium]